MFPLLTTTQPSMHGSGTTDQRVPVRCPFCGKALPVWAVQDAAAHGVWVKCKNPACRREIEIML